MTQVTLLYVIKDCKLLINKKKMCEWEKSSVYVLIEY